MLIDLDAIKARAALASKRSAERRRTIDLPNPPKSVN